MKPVERMYSSYGTVKGESCRDCEFLRVRYFSLNRRVYKCAKYGESRSARTDWRLRFTACGLFQKREGKDVPEWAPGDDNLALDIDPYTGPNRVEIVRRWE